MSTNTKSASVAAPSPVVEGKAIPKDAIVFAVPTTVKNRQDVQAENVSEIRRLVAAMEKVSAGLLARLVLALVLSTVKDGEQDALDVLQKGDGAIRLPKAEVSKARAAYLLVQALGITSTADDRWNAVLYTVGRSGVGAARVQQALKGRGAKQRMQKKIAAIAAAKGDDKRAAVADAFPRQSDGTDKNASAAWRKADRALTTIRDLLSDGDTKWNEGEREALIDALKAAARL